MRGDDRVRHCDICQKKVFNLSEMRKDEIGPLLLGHSEPPCVRLYRRPDGTIVTADCRLLWSEAVRQARAIVVKRQRILARRNTQRRLFASTGKLAVVLVPFIAIVLMAIQVERNLSALFAASGTAYLAPPSAQKRGAVKRMALFGSLGHM
jgi:hypothetical protein